MGEIIYLEKYIFIQNPAISLIILNMNSMSWQIYQAKIRKLILCKRISRVNLKLVKEKAKKIITVII